MSDDDWLLVVAIACAILYGGVIGILVWFNPKSLNAWLLAVGALVSWPFLLVASAAQFLLVIPLAAKFIIDGCDISRPLSRKTVYWAVGTTVAFIIAIVVVGVLLDSR